MGDREGQLQREREREQETWERRDHGGNLRWRETGQGGLSDSRNSPSFRVTIPFRTTETETGQDLAWDHSEVRGSTRATGHRDFSLTGEGEMEEDSWLRLSQREAAGPWRASASCTPNLLPPSAGLGRGLLPEGLLG